jgi:hypothetical protein
VLKGYTQNELGGGRYFARHYRKIVITVITVITKITFTLGIQIDNIEKHREPR